MEDGGFSVEQVYPRLDLYHIVKRVHVRKSYDSHIENSPCQDGLVSQAVNNLLHVDTLISPGLGTRSL